VGREQSRLMGRSDCQRGGRATASVGDQRASEGGSTEPRERPVGLGGGEERREFGGFKNDQLTAPVDGSY
jgi:hypothetical protein